MNRLIVAATIALTFVGTSIVAAEAPSLLPTLGKEPTTIVCLGDSVTGVYYHTGGLRAYPEMLEVALKRIYPAAEITVVNAGISGQTTQHGLGRLESDVLSKKPHLVTISFGLNDMVRVAPDLFRQTLIDLVTRCRAAKSQVVLCTPNAVIDTGSRPIPKLIEYCELIRAVGHEQNVPVCDQFAAGTAHHKRDAWGWRLTMSDEIHPNMEGHKRMAEELCHSITGQRVSLADANPLRPALAKTWKLLRDGKPVRVLAMPPYDTFVAAALKTQHVNAQVEVTPWPVAGKSLAELEHSAKVIVRAMKPDLVILAVPREAEAAADEQFVTSYTWLLNSSLSYGHREWDCIAVHPSVAAPGVTHPRDDLVRHLVKAQDLHLLDRTADDKTSAQNKFERWLADDAIHALASIYTDKTNLLHFRNASGELRPVQSRDDWQVRVSHLLDNMQQVMGPLPAPTSEPLDMQVVSEASLRLYTRRQITFVVEPGDRLSGYLLTPYDTPGLATKRPAMICLPGSSRPGKDAPAGLTSAADMAYAHELAERGYVCLVLDYPLLHNREYKTDPYALGYVSATMKGVVNHRRGVDLLTSLTNVDATKIGVIGHSLGGHNALFLAAFEPRIRAIVSSCGFNVFAKHNRGNVAAWSSRYYMPRIKSEYGDVPARIPFDFTELLAGLAPRAVFVNAPLHDEPDFEVSGVRDCIDAALPVYRDLFHAEEKLRVEYPDAGHTFPLSQRMAAYAFLDQHLAGPGTEPVHLDRGLIAHWPLKQDGRDHSDQQRHAQNHGVTFIADSNRAGSTGVAQFKGRDAFFEVPAANSPRFAKQELSASFWIHSPQELDDLPGDLLSQYDPQRKRGFQISLKSNAGVTFNQANHRHLQFSIDDDRATTWSDCGRPGDALLAFALAVHEGSLYAGTCEPGEKQSGRVYRYAGQQQWIACGAPDRSNAVTAMAVHGGRLYAGVGKYRVAGSALTESQNPHLGGKIYRYEGGERWTDCGQLPGAEAVGGLVEYRGRLYASSLYKPAGFFRYENGRDWTDCRVPDEKRVEALGVFDGFLYATSYDGGRVYRFDGQHWTDCGQLGDNTQTYAFAVYQNRLLVGTWPSGRVYRFEELNRWTDLGRLGEELEVMGMLVHNGRLLAGTLPLAEVYAYEVDSQWRRLMQLDTTRDVKYRRAWTMAEHQGQVFCSTLPSGHVFAFEAGKSVAWEQEFPAGWHHIAAVKQSGRLTLYVDGRMVAQSVPVENDAFNLDTDAPLWIGRGMNDSFCGRMSEVRLYNRALSAADIRELARIIN